VQIQQRVAVGADRVEGDVAEHQHAAEPDDDVESQAEDDVHQGRNHDVRLIHRGGKGVDHRRGKQGKHRNIPGARDVESAADAISYRLFLRRSSGLGTPPAHGAVAALHHVHPQRRQEEAADGDVEHVHPSPLDGVGYGVHLDHHDGEGQQDQPQSDVK